MGSAGTCRRGGRALYPFFCVCICYCLCLSLFLCITFFCFGLLFRKSICFFFEKAEASEFLKGENDRAWTADFDWLIRPTNMSKVLEGKYDGSSKPK